MRAALAAVIALGFGSPAAADDYVTCVQEQLTRLEIDVGPVDGIAGRMTRAGLAALAEREPDLAALPALTRDNASVWCGEIGRQLDLREVWPTFNEPLDLRTFDGMPATKRVVLEKVMREARTFLVAALDVDVPGTIVVIADTSVDRLADRTAREVDAINDRAVFRRSLERQCKASATDTGIAFNGAVAICIGAHWRSDDPLSREEQEQIRKLTSHEFVHEIQGQMTGVERGPESSRWHSDRGPAWLTERIAIAMAMQFVYPNVPTRHMPDIVANAMEFNVQSLPEMSWRDKRHDEGFGPLATYAGVVLAARHPNEAFGRFFRLTPSVGWEKAFEAAFGQTVEDFYESLGD